MSEDNNNNTKPTKKSPPRLSLPSLSFSSFDAISTSANSAISANSTSTKCSSDQPVDKGLRRATTLSHALTRSKEIKLRANSEQNNETVVPLSPRIKELRRDSQVPQETFPSPEVLRKKSLDLTIGVNNSPKLSPILSPRVRSSESINSSPMRIVQEKKLN